jgi:CheY-like chemotaxis protein
MLLSPRRLFPQAVQPCREYRDIESFPGGGSSLATRVSSAFLADEFAPQLCAMRMSEADSEERDPVRRRILVVDDEKLLADTTAAVIRGAGFDARTAYDGWEALEIARSFHPDCLLTDIMMPMMNGVELAIAITKMLPATKIVLFSGQAGIANILEESRSRGYEFPLLAKPVHPLALIESLK